MDTILIVGFSILLQVYAACLALMLIKQTGHRFAWIAIAVAVLLMALRRSITLAGMLMLGESQDPAGFYAELVALLTSFLLVIGLRHIGPLFCTLQSSSRQLFEFQQTILEREKDLRLLFACAPDAYILYDLEGKLCGVNRQAEEWLGRSQQELMGWRITELSAFPPRERDRFSGELRKSARGETTGPAEFTLRMQAGREIVVEFRTYPFKMHDRTLVFAIGCDITERKKIEKRLRESEHKYRLIAENVTDFIWITDCEFRLKFLCPSFETLFGYGIDDMLGRSFFDLLSPPSTDYARIVFEEFMELASRNDLDPSCHYKVELEALRENGTLMICELVLSAYRDSAKQVIGLIGVGRDVSLIPEKPCAKLARGGKLL